MQVREDRFCRELLLISKHLTQVTQQLNAKASPVPLSIRYKRYSRIARPLRPHSPSRVRKGEQGFPDIRISIGDPFWHFRPGAGDCWLDFCCPGGKPLAERLALFRVKTASERLDALLRGPSAHPNDD
jgi:hypothetical protein